MVALQLKLWAASANTKVDSVMDLEVQYLSTNMQHVCKLGLFADPVLRTDVFSSVGRALLM